MTAPARTPLVTASAVALLLSLAGTPPRAEGALLQADGSAVRIAGRVLSAGSGAAIAGAQVRADREVAAEITGSDGQFLLVVRGDGEHVVQVTAEGFRPVVTHLRAVAGGGPTVLEVRLQPAVLGYEEHVVVTPTRQPRPGGDLPAALSVVDRARLEDLAPETTPDALADLPGVLLQKTNRGAGSPYLRGLVGNQVLVLVDGVRLNNATFRYGPNQYLATIDPASVERIEVLRGSGSVLHGSDAIGGVVNVVTRRAHLGDGPAHFSGGFSGKIVTGGMERGGHFDAEISGERAAVRAGLSLRSFGDLVAGGRLGKEAPSGYDEGGGDVSGVVRLGRASLLTFSSQYLRQSDVSRFDQVAQRGYSRYVFDPQVRRVMTAGWQLFPVRGPVARLEATVVSQRTRERRERQSQGSTVLVVEQDTVRTWGATVDVELRKKAGWTVVTGFDAYADRVGSWRRDEDRALGTVVDKRGLYPDGAGASSLAAFLAASWSRQRVHLDVGARYTRSALSAADLSFGTIEQAAGATVGSVGGRFELSPSLELIGALAQSFRAPNVDDVSTLGTFDYGVEVPAPGLSPERAVGIEAGFRARAGRGGISATVYRTSLRDLIDRVRSTYLGDSLFEGQAVYRKANVARAFVRGAEVEGQLRLAARLTASGHLTYAYGQQPSIDQPMRRIPPINGLLSVRWESPWRAWLEARLRAAGAQRRLAPGDLADHRIPKGGTDGWAVVDLHGGRPLGARLRLTAGITNVFDKAYRVHGSGIDGVGRSAWLATRLAF